MQTLIRFLMPLLLSAIVLLSIGIGIQNIGEEVTLHLLKWEFRDLPLILVMIESLAVGMVISIVIYSVNIILLQRRIWRQNREIALLKEEVKALQNYPLTEEKEK